MPLVLRLLNNRCYNKCKECRNKTLHWKPKVNCNCKKIRIQLIGHLLNMPLKSGRISHYELSWYIDDIGNAKEKIDEISVALKDIRQTVSDAPRKYIDNTLDVIDEYYREKIPCNPLL